MALKWHREAVWRRAGDPDIFGSGTTYRIFGPGIGKNASAFPGDVSDAAQTHGATSVLSLSVICLICMCRIRGSVRRCCVLVDDRVIRPSDGCLVALPLCSSLRWGARRARPAAG
jgi:hypothetical protein